MGEDGDEKGKRYTEGIRNGEDGDEKGRGIQKEEKIAYMTSKVKRKEVNE